MTRGRFRQWTPRQAMLVLDLLEDWVEVIWEVHGDRIVPLLLKDIEAPPEPPDPGVPDDLPF